MIEKIFRETTTLGVRAIPCRRASLPREMRRLQVRMGSGGADTDHQVRVKIARLGGEVVNWKLEHDDLAEIARVTRLPLKAVAARVQAAACHALGLGVEDVRDEDETRLPRQ